MDLGQASDVGKVNDLGILPKPLPFGKYYLLEKVNTGGMAEVFKAKAFGAADFERILAVKRILPSIAEDEEFISMFIDEAKIAGQLNHANIAQIFDLGKVAEHYFIALEYIPGRDLRAIFDRAVKIGEKLSIAQVCYVTMKLCEGLDYAHNKRDAQGNELGIVHRDISPQNVLIAFEGECKLIDFGIAKAHGKSSSTQVGILKGKFSYMSPEQVRGGKIDKRSDIFSLGIVLYELLTLERLFLGSSDFSTLEKIRKVEFSPPTLFNPHIPQELEDIVLKSLARDPADRYQSSHEMQDALQKFMFNQGLYYTNKDLASYMKSAFATEISLEQKKLEYYRTLKKEDLDRANHKANKANGKGDGELSWDDDESATNVFDRPTKGSLQNKQDILAELDEIELPEGNGIAYAKPKAPGEDVERFEAKLPPPRQTASLSPLGAAQVGEDVPRPYDAQFARKKSKAPIIIGIVLLLLAIGGVVAFLLLNKETSEFGQVRFEIDPAVPVTVEIDGELITKNGPQMPPIGVEGIKAGANHDYVIRADGFGEIRGSFVVEPDERRPLEVQLSQAVNVAGGTGFSLITTPADATVALDGNILPGPSPFTRTDLDPGSHTLVISLDGYATETLTIDVPENTLVQMPPVALKPSEITLTLQSEPTAANFVLNDKTTGKEVRRGTTTEEITGLPADHKYELSVSKDGYETVVRGWEPAEGEVKDTELVVLKETRTASTEPEREPDREPREPRERPREERKDRDVKVEKKDPPKEEPKDDDGATTVASAPGQLLINSKPPADIFVDGKAKGKTPKKLTLPPGSYTLKLVNPDGQEHTRKVKLTSGAQQRVVHKW